MYRVTILLLFVLVHFSEPHFWCKRHPNICKHEHHDYKRRHNSHDPNGPQDRHDESIFEKISSEVIDADKKANSLCTEDQEINMREVYDIEYYRLIIKLPKFDKDKFDIKIKHRVLYIEGERSSDGKKYQFAKILSDFLNTQSAEWYFGNYELKVEIPYKMAIKVEAIVTCNEEINDAVIKVPSTVDPNVAPDIDIRSVGDNEKNLNMSENAV